jgi:hypothetical protein
VTAAANEDLVGILDQVIEVITERIVDQLHEASTLSGEDVARALTQEKTLSKARRSLEKARHHLADSSSQREGDETLP